MFLILRKHFFALGKKHYLSRNRGIFLLFLHLFLVLNAVSGQSRRSYVRAGDKAFEYKDYGAAIQYYEKALERKAGDVMLMWKYAECARLLNAFPVAEKIYRQLEGVDNPKRVNPLLFYRLGEVLKNQGRYEEAAACFERYLREFPDREGAFVNPARVEIATCQWAQQHLQDGSGVQVVNAGKGINSPYSDFAPYVSGDTLYFSSYRFDKPRDKSRPKQKLTKVLFSVRNGRAREASRGFPSVDTAHVAHTAFTADGHFLFVTLCKNINASDIRCELWLAVQDIRKRWGAPVRLPEPINQSGYTTTHPSVAFDTVTQQLNLWFASDRPGGKGGLDIWYVPLDTIWFCPCNVPVDSRRPVRLPRFEAPPVNAAEINTAGNEASPFFHGPSQVLYFSSDGRPGFGGYDIFQAASEGAAFGAPQNAGPGLNSSYNDLYFILLPDGKNGYLSSNRPGALYLDERSKACCHDIFQVRYPQPPPDEPLLAQTPPPVPRRPIERPLIPVEQLQARDPAPAPALVDFVGLPLYFDNDEPDKRTRREHTRKSYVETVDNYLQRQAEYREQFAAGLSGARREAAEDLIDEFFEQEVRRGYERLDQLCEVLLGRLQQGETVQVIIKGFTSPRAENEYNLALGKRRISSVRNHFETFEDGALKMYLDNGRLQVLEASLGETTVRSGISDDLLDLRNSVYHPDAARERRVEIVEIREKQ